MVLAQQVRTNGITEEVSNKLTNITKSDIESIEHVDVSKNIIDIYNKKMNQSGIKTGIKRIDEDTGGLQPGTLAVMLRIHRVV